MWIIDALAAVFVKWHYSQLFLPPGGR